MTKAMLTHFANMPFHQPAKITFNKIKVFQSDERMGVSLIRHEGVS